MQRILVGLVRPLGCQARNTQCGSAGSGIEGDAGSEYFVQPIYDARWDKFRTLGWSQFPNFSPTTTSYDYDAPINEYGRATEKYYQVRRLLEQYLPEGEQLPPVPDSIPTISIPEFELNENAVLFDNLPEPVRSEEVKSMEYFEQGWGSILYRTKLKESAARQTLVITEANDWTQVFINGERIAALSRLKGEGSAVLPPVKEGDVLDILVEAMGRMNFGKGIYDWKGITEKVELVTEDGTTELKGWEVYNIPVDYAFAKIKLIVKRPTLPGIPPITGAPLRWMKPATPSSI